MLINSLKDYLLPCLNKKLFGFDCLGCGLQRAAVLFFHGEFIAAFKMYPAIYPLIVLFFFIGANMFFKFKHSTKIINILALVTIATIIVSYFIKIIN